jgi:hypothetical protein
VLRLNAGQTETLLNKPESGMGFQTVETTALDGQTKRGTAYNAELLVFDDEPRISLRAEGFQRTLESAKAATEIWKIEVVERPRSVKVRESIHLSQAVKAAIDKAQPAKDAPEERTKAGEVFKRFSAYPNDRRLRPDGGWRDGTYATTEADATNVYTGTEATARYALPNSAPACYVFTGKPQKDTVIQRGTVAPDFGQPGGGQEVIFKKGTQPNAVTGPVTMPA